MIEFLLGPAGSGKTTEILKRVLADLSAGRRVILLVPEQAAVQTESALSELARKQGVPQLGLEVLNFRRLCNRVFREYGGIAYHTVTAGAKALLLWEALFATAPFLKQYAGEAEDAGRFIPLLSSAIAECKAYGISAKELERASCDCAEEDPRLSEKLSDLSILYAEYTRLLSTGFDDPADDLTRLDELLSEHPFFAGYSVYLDAFVGFTPQEHRILSHIFRHADGVTLSFCLDDSRENMSFDNVTSELRALTRLCGKKAPAITRLTHVHRFHAPELIHLEQNLWAVGAIAPYEEETTVIRTVTATSAYDEAEFVACDIARRLREGASFRDFGVVARNIEAYSGILDAVFEKYGLSYHESKRIALSEKPIFKLLLSALAVKNNGWRTEDVISYLKTGLTDVSSSECDLLEGYASRWNILGSRWYRDEDWYMNPDGYTDRLSEEGRELLIAVNDIRRRIVIPLRKLHECLDGKRTVREICHAVFTFLEELDVQNRIASTGKDEDVLLWNAFCDALDVMVDMLPDRKADALLFAGLFSLVVEQTDTGILPSTVDQIAVGSADRIRADGAKHLYLLGVNEGVFPAACAERGLFSDGEKAVLESYGILLSPDTNTASVDELFRFYTAACLPSHTLTVLCAKCDAAGAPMKPSIAFERIKALFPHALSIETDALPLS
ncbi:MAG: hypothetical protein IJD10_02015, partial [Clostridia bacterium]|nr:hypothetical protein [Clostridia bacterium]